MEYNSFMLIKYITMSFSFLFLSCSTLNAQIYDGAQLNKVELNQVIASVSSGTVLVIGEMHGQSKIRDQHLSILSGLRSAGLTVSVGMEFFNYTDQEFVQNYRAGILSEDQFKQTVKWSGFDFSIYKSQLLFPQSSLGEYGVGLNIPRSVTQVISKKGLEGLSADQLKLMPPDFTLGTSSYRERFYALMSDGHIPQDKLPNYFVAQSTWDETMAWQTVQFMKQHPDHVFVIIVGEFHVQYGGGLPNRILARLSQENLGDKIQVKTISQVWTDGMTSDDIQNEITPSPQYGPRADFIFLTNP